jgi:exopolysaccharide production protein ExoY
MTLQLRSNTGTGTVNFRAGISTRKTRPSTRLRHMARQTNNAIRQATEFVRARYKLLPGREAMALDQPIGGIVKRSVDITLATGGLITLFPLFGLVACLVKLHDGGPVLYRHIRLGHGRRSFPCLKFRTMVPNADDVLADHLRRSRAAAEEWAATRKLKSDPRITPVGAALRKLSIDELPQLINVLRGEMSIVGPRPIVFDEIPLYGVDIDFYFCARPGLTGAWQVNGRSNESYEQRVSLDRGYVENWSLWGDLRIVAKTIPAVLAARDAY